MKNKIYLAGILILLTIVISCFSITQTDWWKEGQLIRRGIKETDKGNYTIARSYFDYVLEQYPDSPRAYIGIGDIYARRNQKSNAIFWYYHAIEDEKWGDEAVIKVAEAQFLPDECHEDITEAVWGYGKDTFNAIEMESLSVFEEGCKVDDYNSAIRILDISSKSKNSEKLMNEKTLLEKERNQKIEIEVYNVRKTENKEEQTERKYSNTGNCTYLCLRNDGQLSDFATEIEYDEYGNESYVSYYFGVKVDERIEYKYDKFGNIILEEYWVDDEYTGCKEYVYESGCLMNEIEYNPESYAVSERRNEYNEEGSLVKSFYRDSNGDERITDEYIFDQDEYLVERVSHLTEKLGDITNFNREGKVLSNRGYSRDKLVYDEQGKLIYQELYKKENSGDFSLLGYIDYFYEGGTQTIEFTYFDNTEKGKRVSSFDDKGNLTRKEEYNSKGDLVCLYVYEYTEEQNILSACYYNRQAIENNDSPTVEIKREYVTLEDYLKENR